MTTTPISWCLWFALCDRVAVGTADHPVLGPLPICARCAERVGITIDNETLKEG